VQPARRGQHGRQTLPDALRAVALLGVVVVNAAGYAVAPWGPVLGRLPEAEAGLGVWLMGLQAALLQGKAYPVLAFLFGLGLVLGARRHTGAAQARVAALGRVKVLLWLGVLHGLFIYFGDILTAYALTACTVLLSVHERWPGLRRRWRRALAWALGVGLLGIGLSAFSALGMDESGLAAEPSLGGVQSLGAFFSLNAGAYVLAATIGMLFVLPLLRVCMLAGIAAARLRWLTHRRWAAQRERWLKRLWRPALLLNLAYGAAMVAAQGADDSMAWHLLEGASPLIGLPLAATWVLALALLWQRGQRAWAQFLAPLGQRSLSVYIGHSLLCLLLFSGIGLSWQPGAAGVLLCALALWCGAALLARAAPGQRWPLEAWMARGR
jgi:uncharacterized protein